MMTQARKTGAGWTGRSGRLPVIAAWWLALAGWIPAQTAQEPVKVYFGGLEQEIFEGGTVDITLELSSKSFLEVSVPYTVLSSSTATKDTDYTITEETVSPIVFAPGERRKTIRIQTKADSTTEGLDPETVVLQIDSANLKVAAAAEPLTYTLRILDNNSVSVRWSRLFGEATEGTSISAQVVVNAPVSGQLEIPFTVTPVTASADDLNLAESASTVSPAKIPAGASAVFINIGTVNDATDEGVNGGPEGETFTVSMGTPKFTDSTVTLVGDSRLFTGTILDNDPATANFAPFGDEVGNEVYSYTAEEYETVNLRVDLNGAATGKVTIPVTFSGTATSGSADTGDYTPPEGTLTIEKDQASGILTLALRNDSDVEEEETIVVTLGTPTLEGGGVIEAGENKVFTIRIEDNDPVNFGFGVLDEKGLEADPDKDPYVHASSLVVGEPDGTVDFILFNSSPVADTVEFDLELVKEGTTATLLNPDQPEGEQQWDFSLAGNFFSLKEVGQKTRITLPPFNPFLQVRVTLKDEVEPPVVYGQAPPSEVEGDETVRFRISNMTSGNSTVKLEPAEFTLTIREFPDIDLSALASSLLPAEPPVFNALTGLWEARYRINLSSIPSGTNLTGYRSYKLKFRPAIFNIENPDDPNGDGRTKNPANPVEGDFFEYRVNQPFTLRFPTGTEELVLKEGEPLEQSALFGEKNASTYEYPVYVLQRLNLPVANATEVERGDLAALSDPLDFLLEFTHGGQTTFSQARIHPTQRPGSVGLFLSRADSAGSVSGLPLEPLRVVPLPDGRTYFELGTSGGGNVSIQYWDGEGKWINALPRQISSPGNRLYWIDQGPPVTRSSPAEVPVRFYRFFSN